MIGYSSSRLYNATRFCLRAVDHAEAGIKLPREPFELGVGAHAVLEAVGNSVLREKRALTIDETQAVARQTAANLIGRGRKWEGFLEPPPDGDRVFAGRDLALEFLLGREAIEPIDGMDLFEFGLAVDGAWKNVPFDAENRAYRGVLDRVSLFEETTPDGVQAVVRTRDYKTAWPSGGQEWGDRELSSTQRRGHGLLAWEFAREHWLNGQPADVLRLEVVNLRTRAIYSTELRLDGGAEDTLGEWRADLAAMFQALDRAKEEGNGVRPASPGPRCVGCPFVLRCEAAVARFTAPELEGNATPALDDPEAVAATYAVSYALTQHLAPFVKALAAGGEITVNGGAVGFIATENKYTTPEAPAEVWKEWADRANVPEQIRATINPIVEELLRTMKPSGVNLSNIAKRIYPRQTGVQKAWLASMQGVAIAPRFGVAKTEGLT